MLRFSSRLQVSGHLTDSGDNSNEVSSRERRVRGRESLYSERSREELYRGLTIRKKDPLGKIL